MSVGDLVRWYDVYGCDTLVSDAGLGIVVGVNTVTVPTRGELHVQLYALESLQYTVYRTKLQDIHIYPARDIVPV